MSLFNLFIYFVVIANIFFKSIAWNLLSRIPYSVSVSVSVSVIPFPFPDSGFHILVLPIFNHVTCLLGNRINSFAQVDNVAQKHWQSGNIFLIPFGYFFFQIFDTDPA